MENCNIKIENYEQFLKIKYNDDFINISRDDIENLIQSLCVEVGVIPLSEYNANSLINCMNTGAMDSNKKEEINNSLSKITNKRIKIILDQDLEEFSYFPVLVYKSNMNDFLELMDIYNNDRCIERIFNLIEEEGRSFQIISMDREHRCDATLDLQQEFKDNVAKLEESENSDSVFI